MALIGLGLIGSSLGWVARRETLAKEIVGCARTEATREKALELGFIDRASPDPAACVEGADLVILCVPLGVNAAIAAAMKGALAAAAIVTDVGSVKKAVLRDVAPHIPEGVLPPTRGALHDEYSDLDVGSYPFYENGQPGVNVVIRGPDEGRLDAAVALLEEMLAALGADAVRG